MSTLLRHLPQVERLLDTPLLTALIKAYSREEVVQAVRKALDVLRRDIHAGEIATLPDFLDQTFADQVASHIEAARQPSLRKVINATGIIINTNLGRANLAPEAIAAMHMAGANATNLEFDLETGKRGSRYAHVEALLCELTGAKGALVVNNCAAAVLLSLMGVAKGKKVIASRGELIEIGGAFRLPDVIDESGAILKEVGTTNKTRVSDYARAVDGDTAVLLKSHTSNFRIVGFTAAPKREDLVEVARVSDTIFMEDLGSGVLIDLTPYGLKDEPVVADIIKSGVDLVLFSGDKLLGGPQCGVIAGRADLIKQLKAHPLCRAVRIDKLSLAALEATLRLYSAPHDPVKSIPVLRALAEPAEHIEERANALAAMLRDLHIEDVNMSPSAAYVGGGSMPQQDLESFAVAASLPSFSANALSAALRGAATPVIGRIKDEKLILDARTISDEDLPLICKAFQSVLKA